MGMDMKPITRGKQFLFCSRNIVETMAWIDCVLIACKEERDVERVRHVPGDVEKLSTMIRTTGVGKKFEKITSDCEKEFCVWVEQNSIDLISNLITKTRGGRRRAESQVVAEEKSRSVSLKPPQLERNLFDERIGAFSNRKGIFGSQKWCVWNVHDTKRFVAIHFVGKSQSDTAEWTSRLKNIQKLDKSGVMNRVMKQSFEDEDAFEKLETLGPPPSDDEDLDDLGPPPPEDFGDEDEDDLPPPDLPPPAFPGEEDEEEEEEEEEVIKVKKKKAEAPDIAKIPVPPLSRQMPTIPSSGFFSVGSMLNVNEKISCFPVSLAMMSHCNCENDLNARLAIQQIKESLRSGFQLSPEIALSLMCTCLLS